MSEIRATTISNAAGTGPITMTGQYAAKAWVNFNGKDTVAIRDGGNISSITDNGSGNYTVNFTAAMVDANYAVTSSGMKNSSSNSAFLFYGAPYGGAVPTTNAVCIWTGTGHISGTTAGVAQDETYVQVAIFR